MVRKAWHLLLVIALLAAVALAAPGCDYSGDETAAAAGENVVDLPPMEPPEKGNPKLDSHLNALISAYERGEAEAYAAARDIKLPDGDRVRVRIVCVTGQVQAAVEVAGTLGTVENTSRRRPSIQAVVPIANLTALAEAESILRIRLPSESVPGTTDE